MAKFSIHFEGSARDPVEVDVPDENAARDAALISLGRYLQEHPEFAASRHWRVSVQDHAGRLLLNIVVATVHAARALNLASYDEIPRD